MLFFDMFFYMVYRFSTQTLKRDMDNAAFSGAAVMTVCIGFFVNSVLHLIGVIEDNVVSRWALDNAFLSYVLIGTCPYIFFLIRYFKYVNVEDIKKKITKLSDSKRIFIKTAIWVFIITSCISSYVFYRLYKFEYV